MQFANKVAIVTGGASGIGRAICQGLAREGAKVVVCDLNLQGAEETVSLLGTEALALKADVSQSEDVARVVEETVRRFGRLDILINNAGISPRTAVLEMDEAEWDRVMATNLKSMFLCSKAAAHVMKAQGGGKIVNISSGRGVTGFERGAHYAASKAGVNGLTRSLGLEWARYNINVNAVSPGSTDTPLRRATLTPEELQTRAASRPGDPVTSPEGVVGPVLFLCSQASKVMNGQIIFMKTP